MVCDVVWELLLWEQGILTDAHYCCWDTSVLIVLPVILFYYYRDKNNKIIYLFLIALKGSIELSLKLTTEHILRCDY